MEKKDSRKDMLENTEVKVGFPPGYIETLRKAIGQPNYSEQTGIGGFFKRILYKLSGQKVIAFLVSSVSILIVIVMAQFWKNPSEAVYLKAIDAVQYIAVTLLGIKGIQNGVHAVTDYLTKKNGKGGVNEF